MKPLALALALLLLPGCDDATPDAGDSSTGGSTAAEPEPDPEPTMCLAAECEVDADCNPGLECARHPDGLTPVCAPPCPVRSVLPDSPTGPHEVPMSWPEDTCNPIRDQFSCDDDPPVLVCDSASHLSEEDLHCFSLPCEADTDCRGGTCRIAAGRWRGICHGSANL